MAIKGKSPKDKEAKHVPLQDIIKEEADEAKMEEFGKDDLFDPERDLSFGRGGPTAFQRGAVDRDALVIDELLSSLPKNQGYYLKLYREIMPGKFELKQQINNYDTWTDLELEVSQLVQAMTRKFGSKKWGSGLYRLVVWKNGGIREKNKYPVIDVIVDAGDAEDAAANIHTGKVDPVEAANEQLGALGNMLNAVQNIMPKAVDPNIQFQSIVQAFMAGKGEQNNGNNQMMQMMMTMMTALITSLTQKNNAPAVMADPPEVQTGRMIEMVKNLHQMLVPPSSAVAPKSLVEQIAELKALGFDPFKKEDTIETLARMKAIMSSASEVVPGQAPAERPGIFEKLVDALAPQLPKVIGDLRALSENHAKTQAVQAAVTQQNGSVQQHIVANGGKLPPQPKTSYGQPVGPIPNRMGLGDAFREEPDMDPYSGFKTRPFDTGPADGREDVRSNFASPADLAEYRKKKQAEAMGIPYEPPQPQQPVPQPVAQPVEQAQPVQVPNPQVNQLIQEIGVLIVNDVREAYPQLFSTLCQFEESKMMLDGVRVGLISSEIMVNELIREGGEHMNTPEFRKAAQSYLSGFVDWVKEYENGQVKAQCNMCQTIHVFESKGEYVNSPKTCAIEQGAGRQCQGQLTLMTHDSEEITSNSGDGQQDVGG